jgi:hypothetical protein
MLSGVLNALYGIPIRRTIITRSLLIRKGKLDAWEGSDKRTRRHRKPLEKLAEAISESKLAEDIVKTRYNLATGYAELYYFGNFETIAEIRFIYKADVPEKVQVFLHCTLPDSLKMCFVEILKPLRVEFLEA